MAKHRKKREILHRTDRRIDLGPAGRNLFVSRDKQIQSRQARRIKLGMRVVMALGVVAVAAGVGLFVAFYMVPYFHAEMTLSSSSSSQPQESLPPEEASHAVTYDSMGLPVYGDEITLFVINRQSPADASYVPETTEVEGVPVETHMADALRMLVAAAKEDGLALVFSEGYVSYGDQEQKYEAKVEELMEGPEAMTTVMARTEARLQVPKAGECDQQTGLCVRLEGDPETFSDSQTCSWLRSHMGEYGFVFRYPDGKEDFTGCYGDPMVIRYVGGTHATAMQQLSLSLEEYLAYLDSQ